MTVKCCICNSHFKLALSDYTYINWNEPFICSKECMIKWITSHKNPLLNYSSFSNKLYDTREYKSEYEKSVALFFTQNNIKFHYEFIGFDLHGETYTPDFYLPKYSCFLEVKGLWYVGAKRKMANFRLLYPNIELLVLPWVIRKDFNSIRGVIR